MKGIVIFFSLKEKNRAKETIVDEKDDSLEMRAKRGSLQLGAMIWCEVGRNPLDYNPYGCWCGVGGKGQPVDEIDSCCYVHDKCYDAVVDNGICGWLSEYTVYAIPYITRGCSGCASTGWLSNSKCQKALCECDGAFARCVRDHNSKFQNSYKDYDKSSC
ncbi:phospholipase A2 A2-actitoxin-Cgg2a-like [Porites lutea]|uniref:phospholipase A2 A2-actitoxin-Cgg2a-like n=1 Tax=Porites lutea TaxID=51062 RepID=UPI003CC56FA3